VPGERISTKRPDTFTRTFSRQSSTLLQFAGGPYIHSLSLAWGFWAQWGFIVSRQTPATSRLCANHGIGTALPNIPRVSFPVLAATAVTRCVDLGDACHRRRMLRMKPLVAAVVVTASIGFIPQSLSALQTREAVPSSPNTAVQRPSSASVQRVVKFWVADAAPGSTYETGALHIAYSNGTEVLERLPPKKKSTSRMCVFNQEGIADPQLAEDGQTMGWKETFDSGFTSYAIPLQLALYRSGTILRRIKPGQGIWDWMFLDNGERVALLSGPAHGPEIDHYQLYDVTSGKMLAEAYSDDDTGTLKPDAPTWAKELEARWRNGRRSN